MKIQLIQQIIVFNKSSKFAPLDELCFLSGYQSSMFARLNELQLEGVHYDKDLKKWTVY